MNNAWGSVCDSAGVFTSDEAKVVCRQLGILQVEGSWDFFLPIGKHLSSCWSFSFSSSHIIFYCVMNSLCMCVLAFILLLRWSRGGGGVSVWR